MEPIKKPVFQFRAFTSLVTGFSFVMAALTGAVLFIAPPGRVANWTGWTFGSLTKHEWSGLHIWFCTLFAVMLLLHIVLNMKPIVNYLSIISAKTNRLRVEWLAALFVCFAIFFGTHNNIQPFSSWLAFRESVKFGWEKERKAPSPQAEDKTPQDLAEPCAYSPTRRYNIAAGKSQRGPENRDIESREGNAGRGQGFGKKTLKQVCREYKIDPQQAIDTLHENGIIAQVDMTIRDIADDNGIPPRQIRNSLLH